MTSRTFDSTKARAVNAAEDKRFAVYDAFEVLKNTWQCIDHLTDVSPIVNMASFISRLGNKRNKLPRGLGFATRSRISTAMWTSRLPEQTDRTCRLFKKFGSGRRRGLSKPVPTNPRVYRVKGKSI